MIKSLLKKENTTKLLIIAVMSGFIFLLILVSLVNWLGSEFGFNSDSFLEAITLISFIIFIVLVIALIIVSVMISRSSLEKEIRL